MSRNSAPDLVSFEKGKREQGFMTLVGVDEAGRGPLAGPVCAAAVILPEDVVIPELNDSKKLTEKKREALFEVIKDVALDYGIAFATNDEIDSMNILNATFLAMNRAIKQISTPFDLAIVDGNSVRGIEYRAESVVGGDGRCMSIAAASVLAKVTRDRFMCDMAECYSGYAFEKHKGYGTKAHYEAIRELGPCQIHRMTFLKKMH